MARQVGARVAHVERLVGGITADVDRLAFVDGRADLVLRRWTDATRWTDGLVEREVAGLEALETTDRPASGAC